MIYKKICLVCGLHNYLFIFRDYRVLSEFTIALLEDSGWYKGNYTALSALNQLPLQWGKGMNCTLDCTLM